MIFDPWIAPQGLDEYEGLKRDGGDMRTQVSGVLRVGYYATAAPDFMSQIIECILGENTDVGVSKVGHFLTY